MPLGKSYQEYKEEHPVRFHCDFCDVELEAVYFYDSYILCQFCKTGAELADAEYAQDLSKDES